ncbi:MAG: tRNA lysidine(34) synthetase TilS [Syntrophobacteraceae bacterium]
MTKIPHLLRDRACEYIIKKGLIASGDHLLTAVSGGPDSVALLHILIGLKEYFNIERITVVHFDHRLRGRDSDADREFVRNLANSTALGFRCGSDDVRSFARKKKISIEMAARELRHSFFKSVSLELNAHKIVLGHTADDQAEEVLLRLLRGTGPAGLAAMPPRTADGIIRPLLFATRSEILDYLRAGDMAYREDLTNLEPFCQRNLLRLQIFPLLREAFHPRIAGTISRYAELAAEEESWWATQVEGIWSNPA